MSSFKFPNLSQEQRDELTVTYSACKGPIKHRWDLVVASPDQRPRFGTLALFRCDNCGTYRRDIFSRITGDLLSRGYDYPPGYRDAGRFADDRRATAAEMRAIFAEVVWSRQPDMLLDAEEPKPTRRGKRSANVVEMPKQRRRA